MVYRLDAVFAWALWTSYNFNRYK